VFLCLEPIDVACLPSTAYSPVRPYVNPPVSIAGSAWSTRELSTSFCASQIGLQVPKQAAARPHRRPSVADRLGAQPARYLPRSNIHVVDHRAKVATGPLITPSRMALRRQPWHCGHAASCSCTAGGAWSASRAQLEHRWSLASTARTQLLFTIRQSYPPFVAEVCGIVSSKPHVELWIRYRCFTRSISIRSVSWRSRLRTGPVRTRTSSRCEPASCQLVPDHSKRSCQIAAGSTMIRSPVHVGAVPMSCPACPHGCVARAVERQTPDRQQQR